MISYKDRCEQDFVIFQSKHHRLVGARGVENAEKNGGGQKKSKTMIFSLQKKNARRAEQETKNEFQIKQRETSILPSHPHRLIWAEVEYAF